MGHRVERVVDRHAALRAEPAIGLDHRRPPAIGEDGVEPRQRLADRVRGIASHLVERRRGIDVPIDRQRAAIGMPQHPFEQFTVEHPDTVRLDHDIGPAGFGENAVETRLGRGIDHRAKPFGRLDVAMLLAVEGIGLVEGNRMAAIGQSPQDSAVVGGRAVPVGGQDAGSVECYLHAIILASPCEPSSSAMFNNPSARWAQV